MTIRSINPKNGQLLKEYSELSTESTEHAIQDAHNAFLEWKKTPLSHRLHCVKNLADKLRSHNENYAQSISNEMGKPITQAIGEVQKTALACDYYLENAALILEDKAIRTEAAESFISYQPLGVIFAIMPWNFPFWQVYRAAIPAMLAGNSVLLKHASCVPECALLIEKSFIDAGFPKNLFQTLLIKADAAMAVISHKFVQGVTFTGSTEAGSVIAAEAGKALKKTVLELGGNDPYIILADADLALAAKTCATSRMLNAGQSCIAAKRFIVVESVKKAFESLLIKEMSLYQPADPLDLSTKLGPLVNVKARDELHEQVKACIEKGAKLILGGEVPEGLGAFYPATVLTDVTPGMPGFDDELFGPVACIISAKDEAEAIELANNSPYGLGGAIFTQDIKNGRKLAREDLDAGSCFVNDFVKSDPRLPFGGIKQSGYGRELSFHGMHEFVNIKTVVIK